MKPRRPKHQRRWLDSIRLVVVLLIMAMVLYVTFTVTQFRPVDGEHQPTPQRQAHGVTTAQEVSSYTQAADDDVHTSQAQSVVVKGGNPSQQPNPTTTKQVLNNGMATPPATTSPTMPTLSCKRAPRPLQPQLIPRQRHVIWKDKSLPKTAQVLWDSWLRTEPDWEHIIHTDADCLELADRFAALRSNEEEDDEVRFLPPSHRARAKKHYVYNFSQVYRDYQLNVMRADVCRVLVVYFYGGLYMDLDVATSSNTGSWWRLFSWSVADALLGFETNDGRIANYIIGAVPRHPCMRWVLESMLRVGQDPFPFNRTTHAVHLVTGPDCFSNAIKSCRILPSYFDAPRTLTNTAKGTITCRLEPTYYTSVQGGGDEGTVLYNPQITFQTRHLSGILVSHIFGSEGWKGDHSYESWIAERAVKDNQLTLGYPVDALGRKEWAVTRVADEDEELPTLMPKVRHVVWQGGNETAYTAALRQWQESEPHFTTVVHRSADCRKMLSTYRSVFAKYKVMDALCGLLAVYYHGGLYMDKLALPRVAILEWPGVHWATTDLLLAGEAAVFRHKGGLETTMFGAVRDHPCVDKTLSLLMERIEGMQHEPLIFSSRLAKGMLQCTVPGKVVEREQTVHYVRGFTHDAVRAGWLSDVKGGGRRVQDNYAPTASGFTPRPVMTSDQLSVAISLG